MGTSLKWPMACVAGGLVGCGVAYQCWVGREEEVDAELVLPEGVEVQPVSTADMVVDEKQDMLAQLLSHNASTAAAYRAKHGRVFEEMEEDDGDSDWEDVSDEEGDEEEDDCPGLEGFEDDDFEDDDEDFDEDDPIRALLRDPAFLKEMVWPPYAHGLLHVETLRWQDAHTTDRGSDTPSRKGSARSEGQVHHGAEEESVCP